MIGMEALNRLIKRAVSGIFVSACRVLGRGGEGSQYHICCLLKILLYFVRFHRIKWFS